MARLIDVDALGLALASVSAVLSGLGLAVGLGGGGHASLIAVVVGAVVFLVVIIVYPRLFVTPRREPYETGRLVCDSGPHDVESGSWTYLELEVKEGDRIAGLLTEVDGYDFDWSIVDQDNLAAALRDEDFCEEVGNEAVTADRVKWKVPRPGPWYLLLRAPRRQLVREVEVHLQRT